MMDTAKDLAELAKKGMTIELQQRLMEMQERELLLREENISLKEKLKFLEDIISLKARLTFLDGVYWLKSDGSNDGPYCQHCYDDSEKLIRLQSKLSQDYDPVSGGIRSSKTYFTCYKCSNNYGY
jgi:hypothetical protein